MSEGDTHYQGNQNEGKLRCSHLPASSGAGASLWAAALPRACCSAVYDRLVTQTPGNYETVEPSLATSWDRMEDGKRIRFHLHDDVKFFDGSPLTATDVKFSLDRLLNVKDQPAVYASNLAGTEIVDDHTVDLLIKDPNKPIMINLAAPAFAIYSKAMTEAHGGVSGPEAQSQDQATQWLNQNSPGSGPYHMVA